MACCGRVLNNTSGTFSGATCPIPGAPIRMNATRAGLQNRPHQMRPMAHQGRRHHGGLVRNLAPPYHTASSVAHTNGNRFERYVKTDKVFLGGAFFAYSSMVTLLLRFNEADSLHTS